MNMTVFFLLTFLIICAVAVSLTKDLLSSVLILMGYSTVMSVIWLLLESPDLAITEAAVGAGVTSILFFVTFRRIGLIGNSADRTDGGSRGDGAATGKSVSSRAVTGKSRNGKIPAGHSPAGKDPDEFRVRNRNRGMKNFQGNRNRPEDPARPGNTGGSGDTDSPGRNASAPHGYIVHTSGPEGTIEHAVKEMRYQSDTLPENEKNRKEQTAHRRHLFEYQWFSVLVCVSVIAVLLLTVSYLPRFGDPANPADNEVVKRYVEDGLEETGAVNTVAGMILDYRAFDTLGESNVLFIAVCSVIILLRADRSGKTGACHIPELEKTWADPAGDPILRATALVIVPAAVLFGIYVILNGHLSAGGGFSGGAIIGAAMILYVNAYGSEKIEKYFTFSTYKWVTFGALITYTLLKTYSFYTGANGLESGIPLGTPGAILSGGLILPLNVCVGLVVACTMYTFYSLFRKGEL